MHIHVLQRSTSGRPPQILGFDAEYPTPIFVDNYDNQ